VCDRSRENFEGQCGRKFTCECSYRPCTDRYDVFDANKYFANVCHAAERGKLETLSRHSLDDGLARLFTDGSVDYYLLDARDPEVSVTIDYVHTLPAGAHTHIRFESLAAVCESKPGGKATPNTADVVASSGGSVTVATTVTPGVYLVELSIVDVTVNQTCAEYDIRGHSHTPICPDDVPPCSLHHCFSSRECPASSSFRGCDSLRSRCIESTFGDAHDDDDDDDSSDSDGLLNNEHRASLVVRPSRADCVCAGSLHDRQLQVREVRRQVEGDDVRLQLHVQAALPRRRRLQRRQSAHRRLLSVRDASVRQLAFARADEASASAASQSDTDAYNNNNNNGDDNDDHRRYSQRHVQHTATIAHAIRTNPRNGCGATTR